MIQADTWRRSVPLVNARGEWIALFTVLMLAGLLRLVLPGLTEFKYSEARLATLALEITREGRLPLIGVPSSAGFDHSPLSVYLYVPAFLFTTNPIPATLYGGLVNVAAVALCWWLVRRWPGGGTRAALIAALLLAVNPWAVVFSRKIWQVAFVPILSLGCLGFVVAVFVEGRRWALAWALAAYAVLAQIHPSAVALAPAWLLWLIVFRRRVWLPALLAGIGLGVVTALPFIVHQIQAGWPAWKALQNLPAGQWSLGAVTLAWQAATGSNLHVLAGAGYPQLRLVPEIDTGLNIMGWLILASALYLAGCAIVSWHSGGTQERQIARVILILLSWLLVPVFYNLRYSLDLYLHFFVLIVPAACLVVGYAMADLWPRLRSRWLRTALAGGIGCVVAAQLVDLLLMGAFVSSHDTTGGFGLPLRSYQHVADRVVTDAQTEQAYEVLVVGQGDSPAVDETAAVFDLLLRDRIPYRFVDGRTAALWPEARAITLIAPGAGPAAEWYQGQSLVDITVAPGTAGSFQTVISEPLPATTGFTPVLGPRQFTNGVEVEAYSTEGEIQPGGTLRLWLLWQQVTPVDAVDARFTARLMDGSGREWGQDDRMGYPSIYRRQGDRYLSLFEIPISEQATPELGPYRVGVGVYTYPDLASAGVVGQVASMPADRVVLGPLAGEP
jgi:hypothetical protein